MAKYNIIDMNDGTYRLGKVSGKKVTIVPSIFRLIQKSEKHILNINDFENIKIAPLKSCGTHL